MKAKGEFQIQFEPQVPSFKGNHDIKIGRMSLRKKYTGALEALSIGEMLSATCPIPGHAGYIALEQVIGTLDGHKGSFVIQHFGIKDASSQEQRVEIIPGSGTGQLNNIKGSMTIRAEGQKHAYEITYSLE
jgi:Protein of unknown function (DUF3224)